MKLQEFLKENKKLAVAFSGGVDSGYLLAEAKRAGCQVHAYFVGNGFQPDFERRDALKLSKLLGVSLDIIYVNALEHEEIVKNAPDRCYHCKKLVFGEIADTARGDGFEVVCDGTNADDDVLDRPGMRAAAEAGVVSPLRDCGVTKADIRRRSRELGLPIWNKPAYACLATRIPAGEPIRFGDLEKIERAENQLHDLGFRDVRVRLFHGAARIQVKAEQLPLAFERFGEIRRRFLEDFDTVLIDTEMR